MKHGKLDKRHTGHTDFKYHVNFNHNEGNMFCNIRDWCCEQWGHSSEIDLFFKFKRNTKWAWAYEEFKIKLFFAGDVEYQWFLLKWGDSQ
jgi:hypothetical protein